MNSSAERAPDLEELAAYLDGRLRGERKAEVERRLASDDEWYEIFAEAVRFRAEAGAPAEGEVIAHVERGWQRRWAVVGSLAAAAGIVLAVGLQLAGGSFDASFLVSSLASEAPPETRFGPEWDDPGWSRSRGGSAATDVFTAEQSAFRLGVRSVDLQVALRADDREAARRMVTQIMDLAQKVAGSAESSAYDELRRDIEGGQPQEALLHNASAVEGYLADAFRAEHTSLRFQLGQWSELGRLAAKAADASFLGSRRFRSFLDQARSIELGPEASRTLAAIEDGLRQPQTSVGSLEVAFSDLIRYLAG